MGAWGTGLWSDDTAVDVRAAYREALEDGLDDAAATANVLEQFTEETLDVDNQPVVWLALAVSQFKVGRLTPEVKARVLSVIDSEIDLRRWREAGPKEVAKRAAVLAKVREQLSGQQPARKAIRKPSRPVTSLRPGDVLSYRAVSGRVCVLSVRALSDTRHFVWPVVGVLEFQGDEVPSDQEMANLVQRPAKRGRTANDPGPWWAIERMVTHGRGKDFGDAGFAIVGHVELQQAAQDAAATGPISSGSWELMRRYLERQDVLLSESLAPESTPRIDSDMQ